ncbi:MAG TPA: peptidase U32 family protein [Spirochaetota bacterium]|nr:peptidase U32 family protein [Spirochaetota bacterium]
MALPRPRRNSAEIVAPAGNFEKLRIAVRFGAHAVYFGGERFNLRAGSGNFPLDDIRTALGFCRSHGVKAIFLMNAFLHEGDIGPTREYIAELRGFDFDAIMVSDPGMLALLREGGIGCDMHLSTQMSTLNGYAAKFWEDAGIRRIVLAREVTIDEIRGIRERTGAELEAFVHGALCISYSGRCLLSRYFTGRDANLGECTHPCRWRYALVEENREGSHLEILEHARGTEILSSKDLCLIHRLPDYIDAGVDAFKIEGRMKSLYYTANTARIYAEAVSLAGDHEAFAARLPFWKRDLDLVSHRPYTDDLFNEFESMKELSVPYVRGAMFLGYREAPGADETEAMVKVFNPIRAGEKIEAIYPIRDHVIRDRSYTVREIIDGGAVTDMARPGRVCLLRFDAPVYEDAIFRRVM